MILGITLALGTLMLPDSAVQEEFTAASAYSVEVNDCEFEYTIVEREGSERLRVINVTFTGDTVEIPSVITHNGADYPVTDIGDRFLENNKDIKTVKIPDSVTYIGNQVLNYSSVEKIIKSLPVMFLAFHSP